MRTSLHDALLMLLRANLLPACNGVAATILLTMTEDQLATGTGLARTGHGTHVTVKHAMTLFGDARIMPITFSRTRAITAYGTARRVFTENQRLAMAARDLGCSFPGCDQPPPRCQAHHLADFAITRRTSVDNGTLLCHHHREHARLAYACRMIDGTPHWTPPPWLDPDETPRRNRMHDPLRV